MSAHFDALETRTEEARAADLAERLPAQIARAKGLPGYEGRLDEVDPAAIATQIGRASCRERV